MKFIIAAFTLLFLFSCTSSPKAGTSLTYKGHGKDSVSPEILKKYSPPPVSPETLSTVKKYIDIQVPGLGILHPNTKQVFFTWRVTGQSQVWRVDGPQSFPLQMTGGKDSTYIAEITPDGQWLILTRDEDGQEYPGIYLQSPKGGSLIPIFKKDRVRASPQFVSSDSRWLYFTANDITPESNAIYRYNFKTQTTDLVFSEPGTWYIADYRDNGDLLLVKLRSSRAYEYFELPANSKKLVPILGQDEEERYQVSYSAQANEFIVLTTKFEDFSRLYKFKNGKFTPISKAENFEISRFSMDPKKTKIIYHTNENGYTRLRALNAKNFKPLKLPQFKNTEHIYAGQFSWDGNKMMLGISYAKAPRSSYSYDWKTGKLTSWVRPSAPEIDLSKFVAAKLEYYPSRDGVKIPMFVRRPPQCNDQVCPVIVHFHGGPEGQSTPGFSGILQMFVEQGFVVVEPNVRGSDGYGKKWLDSDNAEKRLNVIGDIEDCAKFIRSQWAKDGQAPKIGVMGWSYGGYATLLAMSKYAGSYDAGVALVGMSNLYSFLQNTAPYRRHLRTSEYGDPKTQKDILLQLSPITYLHQVKDPLMIIQGANDPRVPAGESIQIHEALKEKDIESQLILFADEGHGSQKKENQAIEIGHILQFFKIHL